MCCCRKGHCVCDAVEAIHEMQEAVEEQCPTSCYSNLLSPTATIPGRDTVPFMLFCQSDCDDLFKAFGAVGTDECFKTVFFRVKTLRHDCCATLELLMPIDNKGCIMDVTDPCDPCFDHLERTDFCIEVDLHCFCAIQCLSPDLVSRKY